MLRNDFIDFCIEKIQKHHFEKFGYLIYRADIKLLLIENLVSNTNITLKTNSYSYTFKQWIDGKITMKIYKFDEAIEFNEEFERKEEPKYYLKHKFLFSGSNIFERSYLNLSIKERTLFLDSNAEYPASEVVERYQTQFVLQEIEELKKEFNTDLSDFEIIPVEED